MYRGLARNLKHHNLARVDRGERAGIRVEALRDPPRVGGACGGVAVPGAKREERDAGAGEEVVLGRAEREHPPPRERSSLFSSSRVSSSSWRFIRLAMTGGISPPRSPPRSRPRSPPRPPPRSPPRSPQRLPPRSRPAMPLRCRSWRSRTTQRVHSDAAVGGHG